MLPLVFKPQLVACLIVVVFAQVLHLSFGDDLRSILRNRAMASASGQLTAMNVNKPDEPLVSNDQQVSWKPASHLVRPGRMLDPRRTWLSFLKHSERENRKKKAARVRSTLRNQLNQQLRGPPGPPGARGPRGPPGANITKAELIKEFRSMVQEAAELRLQQIIDEQCVNNGSDPGSYSSNATEAISKETGAFVPSLFEIDEAAIVPRVKEAVFWQLAEVFISRKKSFLEIRNFHVPFAQGSFERGEGGSKSNDGRFLVSRTGIYQIQGTLFMERTALKPNKNLLPRDIAVVMFCINSLCRKNIVLQNRFSLEQTGQQFTIHVTGSLLLQQGEYLSLFVDNGSRIDLKVSMGSQFSAVLLGV